MDQGSFIMKRVNKLGKRIMAVGGLLALLGGITLVAMAHYVPGAAVLLAGASLVILPRIF